MSGAWPQDPTNLEYYTEIVCNEIVRLTENGVDLIRRLDVDDIAGNGEYCHDRIAERLYVRPSGGGNPANTDYIYVAYHWVCITNRQDQIYPAAYKTQDGETYGNEYECDYLPILDARSSNIVVSNIAEFYQDTLKMNIGTFKFTDAAYWYNNSEYIFINRPFHVKIGQILDSYSDFIDIFAGKLSEPKYDDNGITINTRDMRFGVLRSIPTQTYNTTTYANLDTEHENEPIPILFGVKEGIIPVEIDTTTYKYKVSAAVFGGVTYGIQAIDHVYKAGVEIFSPGDYTADLSNGEITLTADPLGAEITVDAQGIKCEFNFATGAKTGNFSENVADILFFILHVLNEIPVADFNLSDFDDLQTARTQRIGWYLKDLTETIEFIKLLQRSTIFYYIINVSGEHTVKYFNRSPGSDVPSFFTEDFSNFSKSKNTEAVFKHVVLNYDKEPMEDVYKIWTDSDDAISYLYDEETTMGGDGIIVALVAESEAEALGIFYLSLMERPPTKVMAGVITPDGMDLNPADVVYLNRSVQDDYENDITIEEEELYTIIEKRANLTNGTSEFIFLRNDEAAGEAIYGDEEHLDHNDDYTDHTDSVHTDTPHFDTAHVDYIDHDDEPYDDTHNDHSDHLDHTDIGHEDRTIHFDDHDDTAHIDHNDHSDTAHVDTPHGDGYDDHSDHTDVHLDRPHTDSLL